MTRDLLTLLALLALDAFLLAGILWRLDRRAARVTAGVPLGRPQPGAPAATPDPRPARRPTRIHRTPHLARSRPGDAGAGPRARGAASRGAR